MKNNRIKVGLSIVCTIAVMLTLVYIVNQNQDRPKGPISHDNIAMDDSQGDNIDMDDGQTNDNVEKDNMNKYIEVPLLPNEGLSYSNPADIKNIGDPFILEAKGRYYCFPTSAPNGYRVWSSDDLVDWNLEGMAYKRTGTSWSGDSYWAPEVVEYNNKYYMFYTARTLNNPSLRIGLAISDNPEGPYIDYADKPFYDPGYAVIDASVFIDDDGRKYMYYSIDCSENVVDGRHESHTAVIELADDLMGVKGEPVVVAKPDQPWEKFSGPEWLWNEGAIVLKRDGKYYMFYSANFYADKAYSVGYAVSDSPMGPFVKHPHPLLWHTKPDRQTGVPAVSGPGHNSLAFSPDKQELFMVYHTHTNPDKPSGNRQVAIDRIGFREDGTLYANGPTIAPQPLPSGARGYTLIQPNNVKASGDNVDALFDGEAGMSQDINPAWHGSKEAWVEMSWDTAQSIATIAVYPEKGEFVGTQHFDLIIDDHYIIPNVELQNESSVPGSCALLNFEPIEASSIKLVFDKKQQNATLSEIMVFSKGEQGRGN